MNTRPLILPRSPVGKNGLGLRLVSDLLQPLLGFRNHVGWATEWSVRSNLSFALVATCSSAALQLQHRRWLQQITNLYIGGRK